MTGAVFCAIGKYAHGQYQTKTPKPMKIEVPNDHDNPENSQLIIVLTGDKKQIEEKLQGILKNWQNDKSPYRKPRQGTEISYKVTTTIITPSWEGITFN